MEKSVLLPLTISPVGSTVTIEIPAEIEFADLYILINSAIPELSDRPYIAAYLDSSNKQHLLLSNEQFKAFKLSLISVLRLLILPTILLPSITCDYGIIVDDTVMALHNNWFDAIVIGSGLAGLCIAFTLAKANPKFRIAILEKENFLGGNSSKASSGISLISTPTQASYGIEDSLELFIKDTISSGKGRSDPALVSALAEGSCDAWQFLTVECGIDLSKVTQCGGHSVPRTHRPEGKQQIGYTLVSALLGKIEKLKPNISVFKNCDAKGILEKNRSIKGILVEYKGEGLIRCKTSVIVISTGGFANDHTKNSLLKEFAPKLEKFPTTNGHFAQGSGIKIARKLGAALVDMDKIQLHPTGFIDPANRDNKTKFLAPELLRGVGAILVNEHGNRFCDELGLRDYITKEICKSCGNMVSVLIF